MPHWSHPSIRGAMQWGLNWTKDTRGASNMAQERIGTGRCAVARYCSVSLSPAASRHRLAVSTAQSDPRSASVDMRRCSLQAQGARGRGEGRGARERAKWLTGRAPHGEQQGRWGLAAPLRGCFPNWVHQERPRLPEPGRRWGGSSSECPSCGCRCDLVKQPAHLHARYNTTWHVYTVL